MGRGIFRKIVTVKDGLVRCRLLSCALALSIMFSASGAYGFSHGGEGHADKMEGCSLSPSKDIRSSHIPTGIPEIYGKELDISFDNVQGAINRLRILGPTYGKQKLVLEGPELERYVDIGSRIACQYCCGAKTLVKPDGEAACGCAHSIMMRALTAYLIKAHPEVSDERILEELNVWKRTFFPKQTLMAKLRTMKNEGADGIDEIINEFPDFLPKMVGGC
jgi:hypothetical protein